MVYGRRRKADALDMVKRFIADVSAVGAPACFRTHNGGAFTSSAFAAFCDNAKTRREYTAPDTPKQNGVAESAI